jgi:hypothetical protein
MSLGKYKNRSEIYSDTFTVDWEMVADNWYCWDDYYYGYWDDYDYCTSACCVPEYSVKAKVYRRYVSRRHGNVKIDDQLYGELIDMDTIYEMGTVYYRERMLRRLLGEEKAHKEMKTTLGDYLKDKI